MLNHKGRIDLRVENYRFNLACVVVGGTASGLILSKANWLLSDDQEKHWFVEGELAQGWSQIYLEFIAGGSGEISAEFRGGWFPDFDTNRHEIWICDVYLEGGEMANPDFRETDRYGEVVGWGGIKEYSDESSDCRSGKRSALIWHDEPAVQKIKVSAGRKYKIGAWFRPHAL